MPKRVPSAYAGSMSPQGALDGPRKLEVVPGKLATVVKPAPGGGKKKPRIVACGNFAAKATEDELYMHPQAML